MTLVQRSRDGSALVLYVVGSAAGPRWSWGTTSGYVDITPAVDLDGDGLTDLLVHERNVDGQWAIRAFRGADGAALWAIEDQTAFEVTKLGPAFAQTYGAIPVAAFVGGDADGDGGADVWITALETGAASAAATGDAAVGGALATLVRADVVSGATGAIVSGAPIAVGPNGAAIALPSGDLDGDALADTLVTILPVGAPGAMAWISGEHAARGAVDTAAPYLPLGVPSAVALALAADGAPLWTRAYAGAAALALPVGDVTGDGVADVLAHARGPSMDALEILSGADGIPAWSYDEPLFIVTIPGDVDQDGALDVLMMEGDSMAGGNLIHTVMVSGATGATLYDTHPYWVDLPEFGWSSVGYEIDAGDFDGDGARDTLLRVENGAGEDVFVRETLALRAVDGGIHWVRPGAPVRVVGDVTGDGITDLGVVGAGKSGVTIELLDGASASTVWSQPVPGAANVAIHGLGDVGGDARADLFAVVLAAGGGKEKGGPAVSTLAAWDGEGTMVWVPGGGK